MGRYLKGNKMNVNMLKAALVGLILSISGFANAGLITIAVDRDAAVNNSNSISDPNHQYIWTTDGVYTGLWGFDISSLIQNGSQINSMSVSFYHNYISTAGTVNVSLDTIDDNWLENSGTAPAAFGTLLSSQFIDGSSLSSFVTFDISAILSGDLSDGYFTLRTSTNNGRWIDFANSEHVPSNQAAFLTINTTEVPEPSTLAIFALGMIGLTLRRFKKKS